MRVLRLPLCFCLKTGGSGACAGDGRAKPCRAKPSGRVALVLHASFTVLAPVEEKRRGCRLNLVVGKPPTRKSGQQERIFIDLQVTPIGIAKSPPLLTSFKKCFKEKSIKNNFYFFCSSFFLLSLFFCFFFFKSLFLIFLFSVFFLSLIFLLLSFFFVLSFIFFNVFLVFHFLFSFFCLFFWRGALVGIVHTCNIIL